MGNHKKSRILIADDEIHLRLFMKKAMTSMNCEIVGEAKNGIEAIELYKKEKPDLLLLDISMPEKTGKEALQEIVEEFPDAFIIMLTSLADMESVEECLNLGASNYIRKDTPIDEIKEIIKDTWMLVKEEGVDSDA